MIVIGAGMAGLLASAMLRSACSKVIEAQPMIPNNHSAVLRFRSTVVADTLNIPFKKVKVMKAVQPWRNPVADAMAYSYKNTGMSTLRSIIGAQGEVETRYISPPDFIQRMADCVMAEIKFNEAVTKEYLRVRRNDHTLEPIISTVPMHILMKLLGWKTDQVFGHVNGLNVKAKIDGMDAYFSLYVPDPAYPGSRISVTGDELTIECPNADPEDRKVSLEQIVAKAASGVGVATTRIKNVTAREQKYAKILPIDDDHRKRFILWASEIFNVYSLGRFATWRPGLLLDDVVQDVRVICRLVAGATAYEAKKGGQCESHTD
jgi:hypothetical protein